MWGGLCLVSLLDVWPPLPVVAAWRDALHCSALLYKVVGGLCTVFLQFDVRPPFLMCDVMT